MSSVVVLRKPSNQLLGFVRNLEKEKEKIKKELISKRDLYFHKK
jgi:hypothetical protein